MLMPLERTSANQTLAARIGKSFRSPEREFSLDAEFTAEPGFTILFGASGSGKTTLLDRQMREECKLLQDISHTAFRDGNIDGRVRLE